MIKIENSSMCCGCTACYNSCPKKAIQMMPDYEGFLYPEIDTDKCIDCGLCEKVCPVINKIEKSDSTQGFIIRNKNSDILFESTSGGAFTVFAEYVLAQGGIVFGAGYDDQMRVVCKKAESSEQLREMRGSKFVQAYLGDVFKQIKQYLKQGMLVLFTGTPCQVSGLLAYLKNKPENLICIDFVCRGVPSPKLWSNYITYMQKKYNSKIIGARFKHKTYGYHATTMKIDFLNGKTYYGSGRVDPYMKAFVREMSSRPSCSSCAFKGVERPSDITMFDCYQYASITKKKDDDKGYTSLFVHSEKGKLMLDAVRERLEIQSVAVNQLVTKNGVMVNYSAKPHNKRNEFYMLAGEHSIEYAMEKINPITSKDYVIEWLKGTLTRLGIIQLAKKLYKKRNIEVIK